MLAKAFLSSNIISRNNIILLVVLLVILLFAGYVIKLKIRINYLKRWKEVQKLLADKSTWSDAILEADHLLDVRLKSKHYKGKTMGERLVSAQHELSANDMVWFSHKFCNKLVNGEVKPNKSDVKKCLIGYWLALKDLGAFPENEQ